MPERVCVMLAADRFYGTSAMIGWCQSAGWGYRIRLKGNLTLSHMGGELTTGDVAKLLPQGVKGAELYGSGVVTNIGVLHEKGHKEPWIIAMDASPNRYTPIATRCLIMGCAGASKICSRASSLAVLA